MDELLERGLVAAMRDRLGLSEEDFGTTAEAEAARRSGRHVIALTTEKIFPQFYDNTMRLTAGESQLALCASPNASTQPDDNPISVFVKTLSGTTRVLEARCSWTVQTLKEAIQAKDGIPVDKQRLVHAKQQLSDTKTLRDYGIENGSTVHVLARLKGGGFTFYHIDPSSFDSQFDSDFTLMTADSDRFYRGGKQYLRPIGSKRYAVRRTFALVAPTRGLTHGHGIYCTPHPPTALGYATLFDGKDGRWYRLILQTRVNPATVSEVKPNDTMGGAYWTVPDGEHIRPYGVCIYPTRRSAVDDPPCSIM
ncbi:hypothetical protein AAVH_26668 [Aphelenchoides avenae]|nr:hypothetical protein AAVH_26668 [Aphelenchus avenae]